MKYLVKIFFLILCIRTLSFGDLINLTKEIQTSIFKTYSSDFIERINYLNRLFDTIHLITKIDNPEHIVLSYKHSVDSKAIILDSVSKKLRTIDNPSTYKPILKSEQFIEEHLHNMLVFK